VLKGGAGKKPSEEEKESPVGTKKSELHFQDGDDLKKWALQEKNLAASDLGERQHEKRQGGGQKNKGKQSNVDEKTTEACSRRREVYLPSPICKSDKTAETSKKKGGAGARLDTSEARENPDV